MTGRGHELDVRRSDGAMERQISTLVARRSRGQQCSQATGCPQTCVKEAGALRKLTTQIGCRWPQMVACSMCIFFGFAYIIFMFVYMLIENPFISWLLFSEFDIFTFTNMYKYVCFCYNA